MNWILSLEHLKLVVFDNSLMQDDTMCHSKEITKVTFRKSVDVQWRYLYALPPKPKYEEPKGFGARHLQALLLFTSLTVGYSMRAQLSVSLVAMTDPHIIKLNNTTDTNNSLVSITVDNSTISFNKSIGGGSEEVGDETEINKWNVYRTYNWDKPTQEMILFAFFVGYTTMMMPMGIIAQKYGGKLPILVALGVNGVISILTPWIPLFAGWIGICICRLLQGMTQAAFFPSIHTILGKWTPLKERGRLSTYVYTGSQFGTILIFQISGVFAGNPALGWPSIFWLCGVLSLICFALYGWFGSASPYDHPTISSEELILIMGEGNSDIKKRKTPWSKILTSTAVWGLVTTHSGSAIGYLLMLTQTPTYMSNVLGVDIKHNGLYSSLPYIAMYVLALVFGYISDFLVSKNMMSIANVRRMCNTIGMWISGLFLIAFGFVQNTTLAVILLILCLGLHSGVHVGFHINHIDLAPNFAGPIMALGNMVANLTSLLVPVMVSNILGNDVTNQHRWQILFTSIAAFQILTNVVFVVFVKGTVQPWNYDGEEADDVTDADKYVLKEKNKLLVQEMKLLQEKSPS